MATVNKKIHLSGEQVRSIFDNVRNKESPCELEYKVIPTPPNPHAKFQVPQCLFKGNVWTRVDSPWPYMFCSFAHTCFLVIKRVFISYVTFRIQMYLAISLDLTKWWNLRSNPVFGVQEDSLEGYLATWIFDVFIQFWEKMLETYTYVVTFGLWYVKSSVTLR